MTMRSPGRAGIALDDASLDGVAECPDVLADAFLAAFVTLPLFAVAFFAGAFLAGMRRLLKLAVPVRLRPSYVDEREPYRVDKRPWPGCMTRLDSWGGSRWNRARAPSWSSATRRGLVSLLKRLKGSPTVSSTRVRGRMSGRLGRWSITWLTAR